MIDLAIVGAGSAGIAAAKAASSRGLTTILLEASSRVGGRAHSRNFRGYSLDLGAGWLHSANRNPLAKIAEHCGFAIDRSPTPWRGQFRSLGFSLDDQRLAYDAFSHFNETVESPQIGDIAANALPKGGQWNAFIEALSGYLNGTSLRHMSARDYSAYSKASTACNWRLPKGYGSLIEALAKGVQIEHDFKVSSVVVGNGHVRLSSSRGSVTAGMVIVTVSTNVLASGSISFSPSVADHLEAAANLPLGLVEKLFFSLADVEEFPSDAHLIGNSSSANTGSYMLNPMGMPVVEGFFGGDWVKGASVEDLETLAREELTSLLGGAFDAKIHRIASSGWKEDPLFGGSYSYARPNQHESRLRLALPVGERIAFAGEACSPSDFSTVHGAWESGIAAVEHLFGPFAA